MYVGEGCVWRRRGVYVGVCKRRGVYVGVCKRRGVYVLTRGTVSTQARMSSLIL